MTPRSHRNPAVVEAARLHHADVRRERHQTILEGPNLVGEAAGAGIGLLQVFALPDDAEGHLWAEQSKAELIVVGSEALERLSETRAPQSPVAVIAIPKRPLSPGRSLLVAWEISDPGNLGTMIRTAAGFGLDLVVGPGGADPWSPKVLRAGAGGHFRTGIEQISDLASIEATTIAAVATGGEPIDSLPFGRVAILIGSEARGLPDLVVEMCDLQITIPMAGHIESLNAAAAAAIMAYVASSR